MPTTLKVVDVETVQFCLLSPSFRRQPEWKCSTKCAVNLHSLNWVLLVLIFIINCNCFWYIMMIVFPMRKSATLKRSPLIVCACCQAYKYVMWRRMTTSGSEVCGGVRSRLVICFDFLLIFPTRPSDIDIECVASVGWRLIRRRRGSKTDDAVCSFLLVVLPFVSSYCCVIALAFVWICRRREGLIGVAIFGNK